MDPSTAPEPRRRRWWKDFVTLGIIGVLLFAAIGAGGVALYRHMYGPAAFVVQYLDLLSNGRAADALRVPGVTVDRSVLRDAGIDPQSSDVLLRRAALTSLSNIEVVSVARTEEVSDVTVSYIAGGHAGTSTFSVEQDGWMGVLPNWRFATSPLASIQADVRGSDAFSINGFPLERPQVSPDGASVDPYSPLSLLTFTPGLYTFDIKTPTATSPGVAILTDTPLAATPLTVDAEPTPEFTEIAQQRVAEFLTACTQQPVLQPSGCPFGLQVSNRIVSTPEWSIAQQPVVSLVPDGSDWVILPSDGLAHIDVAIKSLFDGRVQGVSEDVPFRIDGSVDILQDGTASIIIGTPDLGEY